VARSEPQRVAETTLSVLDGSTFVLSDRDGDVRPGVAREHGFFSQDTRFVSEWSLRLDGRSLDLLGQDQDVHFAAQLFLTPHVGPQEQAPCSVMRRRCVDRIWLEEITIINHSLTRSEMLLELDVGADFADLFEVKDGSIARREVTWRADDNTLVLSYEAGAFQRSVTIASDRVAEVSRQGFAFALGLERGEQWTVALRISPHAAQSKMTFATRALPGNLSDVQRAKEMELEHWLAQAPILECEDPGLARTYRASLTDLAALRLQLDLGEPETLPAAGLPWFMALFGRDSLITSFQALPYLPTLAANTLRGLAARQAQTRDDFHDQEPGKILHELRFGELTATGVRPHSPYYGTADATPLFVVLLDEYHRWTGDDSLIRTLEPNARAALAWIDDSGDMDGDGYVEYERRNLSTGLINQCWKDSWDSMQFANGTLATGPIATCEIQGYVYDARRRAARLARDVWNDPEFAERLETQATALRHRFHTDFWMAQRGGYALALDGEKRQVDSMTSNIGHPLWSGLAHEEHAATIAKRLLAEPLYSGWGVRTLGTTEAGYNPLGYHTGTVWPHENALIVAGLARYGHHDAAVQITRAILAAAPHFEHRLPEVFAGYPASITSVPVEFPTASRPQAWAAGAPLMLITTLLGLTPGHHDDRIDLPTPIGRISLTRSEPARDASSTASLAVTAQVADSSGGRTLGPSG
jgi:glycogen debranching enzyme